MTADLLVRIAVRALLPVALALWAGGLVVALHCAAAVAGATFVERVALRRGTPAWRCALETSLACALLHLVLIADLLVWEQAPWADLQTRATAAGALLESPRWPTAALGCAAFAWLFAGPSGAQVLRVRVSMSSRTGLGWLAAWLLPLGAMHFALNLLMGLSERPRPGLDEVVVGALGMTALTAPVTAFFAWLLFVWIAVADRILEDAPRQA